jgi:hypothetical protein
MKNALTFWDNGKLQRSGIFVVLRPEKFISLAGAASSELFAIAPGRSPDSLCASDSPETPALTGLVRQTDGSSFPFKASQALSRLLKAIQRYSSILKKVFFYFYVLSGCRIPVALVVRPLALCISNRLKIFKTF